MIAETDYSEAADYLAGIISRPEYETLFPLGSCTEFEHPLEPVGPRQIALLKQNVNISLPEGKPQWDDAFFERAFQCLASIAWVHGLIKRETGSGQALTVSKMLKSCFGFREELANNVHNFGMIFGVDESYREYPPDLRSDTLSAVTPPQLTGLVKNKMLPALDQWLMGFLTRYPAIGVALINEMEPGSAFPSSASPQDIFDKLITLHCARYDTKKINPAEWERAKTLDRRGVNATGSEPGSPGTPPR